MLLSISAFTANAQQLPNVGFESWKTTCGSTWNPDGAGKDYVRPGVEPSEWNGSNVNQLGIVSVGTLVTQKVEENSKYVVLKNKFVGISSSLGSVAPGFISIGKPWVFASANMITAANVAKGDGGTYGGAEFAKKPDALTLKYKRTAVDNEVSRIIACLWKGTFVSKDIPNKITIAGKVTKGGVLNDVDRAIIGRTSASESGELVAKIDAELKEDVSKWTTIVIPFEYSTKLVTPEKMNVIISAGDYWNRGNLKENTTLLVDDVDFVYYSTLTSLTVGDETIALQDGVYNYNFKTNMPSVSKKDIVAVCKSQFADADVTIDNVNKQIKIVVTNQGGKDADGATSHTYTLQYPTYQGYLNVKMGYGYIAGNDAHGIIITDNNDGTCDFLLPYLTVLMPLGDIEIKNMNVTTDASGLKTYSGVENNKKLMNGAITANVRVNGTIDAKGTVNMDVDVDWLNGEDVIPIKVKFTSSELSEVADGYYFIVKEDKSNAYGWATIKENQPTQLLVYPKSNGEGGADYRLTVKNLVWDGMLNGDFVVEGAAIDEDENSNPIYFVENAPVSFMGGKTASVSVNSGYDMTKDPYEYDMKFNTIVDGTNYIVGFTTNQVSSSVNDVEASGAAVRGAEGAIVVEGFAGRVNVYTVDGRLAASAQIDGEATITVAAGLYVVRAGEKAVKVVVK